ncbi:hypothetical protein FFF34_009505 [Inquilinus sp. KBS0705]|nr:hypothetical protein FFF34_009505 [Inquilinus sp. KBS0705]
MKKKLSLGKRLLSATPAFFKRAQLFGVSLAGLGTSLTQVIGIPVKLCTILITAGTTITVISQFAVEQYEPINHEKNEVK